MTPNEERLNQVALEVYIHSARGALQLLDGVREELIALRGDGVEPDVREEADLAASAKLLAAEGMLAAAIRYHETGSVS